jgi:hydrogenase nickel incorporation protein HypA/HybF
MHELSLAGGILRIVEQAAVRERFERVTRLTLEVGKLSGVEVEALRFSLGAIAPGTPLAGAQIEIDETEGQARCFDCDNLTVIKERGDPCGHCGGWRLEPVAGTQFRVIDLLVEDGEEQ